MKKKTDIIATMSITIGDDGDGDVGNDDNNDNHKHTQPKIVRNKRRGCPVHDVPPQVALGDKHNAEVGE